MRLRSSSGQASVEWLALVALVGGLLIALLAVGPLRNLGTTLTERIAAKILCAVRASGSCDPRDLLAKQYGDDIALLIRRFAPGIVYETGGKALPVDFRRCLRDPGCGDGPNRAGAIWRSSSGEPTTAFVRVIDRRSRGGPLYVQYWLYYADSATGRGIPIVGAKGYHPDDWEGMQVRWPAGGEAEARASSHHGYSHGGGKRSWPSDLGLVRRSAWGRATGWLWVSGGSHAGHLVDGPGNHRYTPADHLRLVPIESLDLGRQPRFAISPPWRKPVYRDPESTQT